LGIATAIVGWVEVASIVLNIGILDTIAAVAIVILEPIVFIWLGLRLRQAG
jgi:hypothetical protein